MAYSGKYYPKDIKKYRGDYKKITYRSSWEHFIMTFLDSNPNVKWRSSETTVIPYFSNADGKKRRYFMDFTICWDNDEIHLWEVKPQKECHPPVTPSTMTTKAKKQFMAEAYTWTVNSDKWKRTVEICEEKGWKFRIITEAALKKLGFKGLNK